GRQCGVCGDGATSAPTAASSRMRALGSQGMNYGVVILETGRNREETGEEETGKPGTPGAPS
ncbi:MAG: hypothetical protein AB2810_15340, partial [Candidatus Thiodiazotropha endolucinida]